MNAMQDLFVYDQSRIKISGVNDIAYFAENEIILETQKGGLVIYGSGMKIGGFDSVKHEAEIRGVFCGCEYFDESRRSQNGKRLKQLKQRSGKQDRSVKSGRGTPGR